MVSSTIVSAFNSMAGVFSTASTCVPSKVQSISHLFEKLGSDPKNFFLRPAIFVGDTIRLTHPNLNQNPTLAKLATLSAQAATAKLLISALEVFSNLPGALSVLASPVKGSAQIRSYAVVKKVSQSGVSTLSEIKEGPHISGVEIVAKKMFSVALWFISLGDAANAVKSIVESSKGVFPQRISRVVPWVQITAGTFMGLWGVYEESKFAAGTWLKDSKVCSEEKYYNIAKLAMSVSCLAYSILVGLEKYYGKAPSWLEKAKFIAGAATTVTSMVVSWMKDEVAKLHDPCKTT